MAEYYRFSKEIFDEVGAATQDASLLEDIDATLKRKIVRHACSQWLKGRWRKGSELLKQTGLTWKEVRQYYTYKSRFNDPLTEYTPARPFKKGFLNKL